MRTVRRRRRTLIEAYGRRAVVAPCDVSDPEQIRNLFRRLDAEFGRIDFLGNVAGDGVLGSPEEISLEDVEQSWRNLVLGRFCMCQEAGRRMLAAGGGSIVNIGSLASITALGRGHIAYSMAMGAVAQMTRELSTEWSGRGVRVNAILPAQVLNPALEARIAADPAPARLDTSAASPPAASAIQTTSKASPCFSLPTRQAGSRARSSRWTAAIWP